VEHLSAQQLQELLVEAQRVLRVGGTIILETVNPHAPAALKAFWVDRTHEAPVFPEVLLVLTAQAGFHDSIAYCPFGTGDYEYDRLRSGEYAIVAHK
jgi:ubiquinone/menaquinone biosynthesis C-methylase UbiE